jgi:hypothetical protein
VSPAQIINVLKEKPGRFELRQRLTGKTDEEQLAAYPEDATEGNLKIGRSN